MKALEKILLLEIPIALKFKIKMNYKKIKNV